MNGYGLLTDSDSTTSAPSDESLYFSDQEVPFVTEPELPFPPFPHSADIPFPSSESLPPLPGNSVETLRPSRMANVQGDGVTGEFGTTGGLVTSTVFKRKEVAWPEWDGTVETFAFYTFQLAVKLEGDAALLGTNPKLICLSMIGTLPSKKRIRVSQWFQKGGPNRDWNTTDFLRHFEEQFEDKQARQSAAEELSRMRQGIHQLFTDYLQDFEYKLAQCGGMDWPGSAKTVYLNTGINQTLKAALVTKTLPDNDYDKWVLKVKTVAGRVENLATYKPKGAAKTKTWFVNQAGAKVVTQQHHTSHEVDADGDTPMGGINAIVAAVVAQLSTGKTDSGQKPAAVWKDRVTFQNCINKKLCVRCEKKGHPGHKCPTFGPAKKPAYLASAAVDEEEPDESEDESGKD